MGDIMDASQAEDLGATIMSNSKSSKPCTNAANAARKLFRLMSTTSCKEPEVFEPLQATIVRPHPEHGVQAWAPCIQKDIKCLEKTQKLATKAMAGQRRKINDEGIHDLGTLSQTPTHARGPKQDV